MGRRLHMKTMTYVLCLLGMSMFSVYACSNTVPVIGTRSGDEAPNIVLQDINGKSVALKDLRGKLVLVEFWDAANAASRRNHFEMQRMYAKHKNTVFDTGEGFAVYSISIDTNTDTWKKAVQEDGLTFNALLNDPSGWNSKAVLDYNINSLPKYFLINKNGIIINHNILIPDLERILTDQM